MNLHPHLQLRFCEDPSSSPSWTLESTLSLCSASSSKPAAARRCVRRVEFICAQWYRMIAPADAGFEQRRLPSAMERSIGSSRASLVLAWQLKVSTNVSLCRVAHALLQGDKCKYSHDLTVGRKAAKIDLYSDRRDGDAPETNADWDQAKLEEVVRSKHGAEAGAVAGGAAAGGAGAGGAAAPKATEIVCKFFLDAIEKEVYGWFWKCPNGESDTAPAAQLCCAPLAGLTCWPLCHCDGSFRDRSRAFFRSSAPRCK